MDKIKEIHRFFILIFVICIFFLASLFLNNNLCISVIGDEFGYYSAAAFFSDKPWQSLTASNSYYGWGYGALLAPLLALSNVISASTIYQLTILFNAFMLTGIFFIAYDCTKHISKEKNKFIAAYIAGFITFYPSNLYGLYNAMPELLLQLLYWGIIRILLGWIDSEKPVTWRKKIWKSMMLLFLIVFSFAVHQRTVGLLIVSVICLFLSSICSDSKRRAIGTIFFLSMFILILLFIVLVIKSKYMEWIYADEIKVDYIQASVTNDFSSYASRISSYFSLEALKSVTISMIGKVFYSNVSSALLLCAGLIIVIKKFMGHAEYNNYFFIYLFSFLGWLQAVVIAAIAMPGGFESRTDILIYGRYIEYTFGPLIMLGLLGILEESIGKTEFAVIIILQCFLTFVVKNNIAQQSVNTNMGNIFTIAKLFDGLSNTDALCACSLTAILLFMFTYFLNIDSKYAISLMSAYIIFEIIIFVVTYKTFILPWQDSASDNVNLKKIYLEEKSNQENLYLFESEIGGKMLQFLMPNEECIVVNKINEINKGNLIATAYTKENEIWINENYDVIYQNKILILWRK